MTKKIITIVYISLFFLMLALPALFMNRKENVISQIDNRALQEAPIFGEIGYTKDLESYLSDRIGFRSQMIRAYTQLNDTLFHEMVHPTYTYGQNGYVFFKMHNNVQYSDYHEKFADMVLKMQEYCESRGTRFYFMFDPEKISVYREYLSKGVVYNDDWVVEFLQALDDRGVRYVDNWSLLRELGQEEQVFNVQYNAGHWNDLGCFYGMNNLFSQMHEDFPEVRELTFEDFEIGTKHRNSLQVSEFAISEDEPSFQPKNTYIDKTEELTSEIEIDPQYRHVHYYLNQADNADDLPRVLIFQGSYLNSWTQYMFNNTSSEIGIHNYQNIFDLPYYYNIADPDAVVFEVAEYTFSNQYFNEQLLVKTEFAPALTKNAENVQEEMAALIDSLPEFPIQVETVIVPHEILNEIMVSDTLPGTRYVYLCMADRTYDLTKTAEGVWHTAVLAERFDPEESVLVVTDDNGRSYKASMTWGEIQPIPEEEWSFTEGVVREENDDYTTMKTEVDNNEFSSFRLQLYDETTGEYIKLDETSSIGEKREGFYHHTGESGYFTVIWRGNTNLKDERIYKEKVLLEKGKTYYYAYELKNFQSKEILVKYWKYALIQDAS